MNIFNSILSKIGPKAMVISGAFLLGIMLLIVVNIILRGFGGVIAGSYELIEVLIVIVVAGALGYTELKQGHVSVKIVVSRLSQRVQSIFEGIIYLVGAGIWAIIIWASIDILLFRWHDEETYLLQVPLFPFRIVWIIGLAFLCLVLLFNMVNGIRKAVKK